MTNKKTIKRTTTNLLIYDEQEKAYFSIYKDIENGTRWLMEKEGTTYYYFLSYIREFPYLKIIKQEQEQSYNILQEQIEELNNIINKYNLYNGPFNTYDETEEKRRERKSFNKTYNITEIFRNKFELIREQNNRIKELNNKYIELIKELKEE